MDCFECGKKIAKARLKVLPDTTLCVQCAKDQVGVTVYDEEGVPKVVMMSPREAKIIDKENKKHGL